jgi:hypothetical protein
MYSERRTYRMAICNNGCGTELKWDKSRTSDSGKMIPIEVSTNEPHNCPKSPYNQKQNQSSGGSQQTTMDTDNNLAARVTVLEAAVKSLQDKE